MIFFFKNDGDLSKFLNCIEDTGDTFFANIKDIGENLVADINNTGDGFITAASTTLVWNLRSVNPVNWNLKRCR
jgi:hypothetical protein